MTRRRNPEEERRENRRKTMQYRWVLRRGEETCHVHSERLANALRDCAGWEIVGRQRRRQKTGGVPDLNESNWTEWYEENRRLLPPE